MTQSYNNTLNNIFINIKNFNKVQHNIEKYSPHPKKVKIIAVTKTFDFSAIKSAEKNKIFYIGESRVQETEKKIKQKKLNANTELHLIGHLQSNKVARAIDLYDTIQSVDSLKLLNKINKTAKTKNKKQKIFLQINISKTPTQKGLKLKEILDVAQTTTQLKNIFLEGIMVIGENTQNKKTIKENFYQTQQIQKQIQKQINPSCRYISMGMSQDYILALQAGATHLRLGTILFTKHL